jgi:hypothetical protein
MRIEKDSEVVFNNVAVGDNIFLVLPIREHKQLNLIAVCNCSILKDWGILDLTVHEKKDNSLICKSPRNPGLTMYIDENDEVFFNLKDAKIEAQRRETNSYNDFVSGDYFKQLFSKENTEYLKKSVQTFNDILNQMTKNYE